MVFLFFQITWFLNFFCSWRNRRKKLWTALLNLCKKPPNQLSKPVKLQLASAKILSTIWLTWEKVLSGIWRKAPKRLQPRKAYSRFFFSLLSPLLSIVLFIEKNVQIKFTSSFLNSQGLGKSQQSPPHTPGSPGMMPRKDSNSNQLVASDPRSGRRDMGRDFFSNVSSDLNGIAAQTSSMFSDLFGKSVKKNGKKYLHLAWFRYWLSPVVIFTWDSNDICGFCSFFLNIAYPS